MKTKPSARAMRENNPEEIKARTENICRIVAIVVAGVSTYFFFIKILFL